MPIKGIDHPAKACTGQHCVLAGIVLIHSQMNLSRPFWAIPKVNCVALWMKAFTCHLLYLKYKPLNCKGKNQQIWQFASFSQSIKDCVIKWDMLHSDIILV